MRIVNLTQSRVRYSDINLIKVESGKIFYAVQIMLDGKCSYELREYEIDTNREVVARTYDIGEDAFYMQRVCIYEDEIIIMRLENKEQVNIEVLGKKNGELIKHESILIPGIIGEEVTAINERYFLVSGEDQNKESLYYLCDIEEERSYLVTMERLLGGLPAGHGLIRKLPCFKHEGKDWVVFNECYMEDYEYEDIFDCIMAKNFEISRIKEREGIYVIEVDKLVEGIKKREDIIPFQELRKRWIDGWVRYLGIKNGNIYYREKDFGTQIEKIWEVDTKSLEQRVVCEINHKRLQGALRYDLMQIYEDIRHEEKRCVKGHYGLKETLDIPMHKRLRFEGYLEGRYIITSWWWENEVNGVYEYKEFVGIQDKMGEDTEDQMLIYEGQCYIQEDLLLIY